MTDINVPDFMPVLSAGKHFDPSRGACIMEYISFLSGDQWTDYPRCTNFLIARWAQYANDYVGGGERQKLLPLIPRLMAAGDGSPHVNLGLRKWLEPYEDITDLSAFFEEEVGPVEFLTKLLDEYDRLTNCKNVSPVSVGDLARCAELTKPRV